MHHILLAILCSVAVSVLLKLAVRWRADVRQAIAGSYLVAATLAALLMGGRFALPAGDAMVWPVILTLGVLLPGMFLVLAVSIARVGMVKTDAAQRLSLLVPLAAAFTLFGEALAPAKGAGLALGLVAIVLVVVRRGQGEVGRVWGWPVAVFAGMGVIDILFKLVAGLSGASSADILLPVFLLAFLLAAGSVAILFLSGRAGFAWRNIGLAVALGGFNFGNIHFYVEAHRHLPGSPSLVFSLMNIGVILLAAIVGMAAFRERLQPLNILGLGLAAVAILVLAAA